MTVQRGEDREGGDSTDARPVGHAGFGLPGTDGPVRSAQVLIVDDEADVIEALKLRLETAGYRAITASDGAEALKLLRHTEVDLILADLMMPNLDGLELTRRVRQDPSFLRAQVLLFSCNDDPVSHSLALEFGALDYLSKAIGAPAIVSRVHEILNSKRPSGGPPPGQRPGYEGAERTVIVQLRAMSDASGPTAHPRENIFEIHSKAWPPGGSPQGPDTELVNLAKALGDPGAAGD